jgi:adenylosuccinate lyase
MAHLWSLSHRYQCWLDVSLAVCRALHHKGIIPQTDYKNIKKKARFDEDTIAQTELVTRHDMIAFLTVVSQNIGASGRWLHYGMTSSDVLDTATALQCRDAGHLLLKAMHMLCDSLKNSAMKYRDIVCIGRSHGIHAEPTSFGLKYALWYDEMRRNITRMQRAIKTISVGKMSGAVGNFAHISPEVETLACRYLGLTPANIATQVIQRDIHAEFLTVVAIISTTIEKIAIEIRHLQRTEVLEVEEGFASGQKGSSAMPHKKNPITSEQLSGLARLLRANSLAALENNALWHERDLSHSSVERVILPDGCILLDYMLHKAISVIDHLIVHPQNIQKNLELTNGLVFSQVLLLRLAEKGMSREDAYKRVQSHAMKCWQDKSPLYSLIKKDKKIMAYLSLKELGDVFSYQRYTKNVDKIYQKVFR